VTDLAAGGAGASDLRLEPAEPVSDSSRSRVAAYQAGFGWDGGGILFSDSRGRWSYGFGVDNADAGRSGGVDQTSTRVAMIDLARGTWWGRLAASLRGTEAYYLWKNGNRMKHDDQGVHLTAVIGDSLGPAWSLRVGVLDDRLSGSEFPDVEFRRKRLEVEARWWERPTVPVWGRVVAERDWFAVRFTGGEFAPRVNRSRAEAGTRLALGATRLHLVGTLSTSGSHPLRAGAQAELEVDLAGDTKLGIGGGRAHRLPTLDQDVLAWGQPVAEPERHDAFSVRLNREGRLSFDVLGSRRHLDHQPLVTAVHEERPWPQFEFAEAESRHWEVRAAASIVGGPLGFEFGVSGSRLFAIDDESDFVPFVPEAVGRAFAALRLPVFGDDMILRPRIDLLAVGDRNDLDRRRIGGHARLDGTLVAVMGRDLDLELGIRNLTDRRYPLAVLDPDGELYVDSGRMSFFFLRWRFLN
jgi:hypothetical protein